MDEHSIHALNTLNRQFYAHIADDFDATRANAWQGWVQLFDFLKHDFTQRERLSIIDIGCGNARFASFMAEQLPYPLEYHGLDNSAELLKHAQNRLAQEKSINAKLDLHDTILEPFPKLNADLVVLFGVLHHIPSYKKRQQLIRDFAQAVNPNGWLIFTGWRFYEDEKLRGRITAFPEGIQPEKNDYILDWRRGAHALRYCHYVDDAEEAELIDASGLNHLHTFRADGANQQMNSYVILQKEG